MRACVGRGYINGSGKRRREVYRLCLPKGTIQSTEGEGAVPPLDPLMGVSQNWPRQKWKVDISQTEEKENWVCSKPTLVPALFDEVVKKTSGNGGSESHFHAVDSCQIYYLSNYSINQSPGCYHNSSNQERGSDPDATFKYLKILLVRHDQSTDHHYQSFTFPTKKQKQNTSGTLGTLHPQNPNLPC